jgi:hypothetical protein
MDDFIDKLLDFESEELLNYKVLNGSVLIWSLMRYFIMNEAISKYFNLQPAHARRQKLRAIDVIKYVFYTLKRNPYKINRDFNILVFAPAIANSIKKEEKFFNRIYDYFNLIYPNDTISIEDSDKFKYYEPRFFKNVRYRDWIKIIARLEKHKVKQDDLSKIEEFISYIREKFPFNFREEFYNELKIRLLKAVGSLEEQGRLYKKLFEKIKPKIIFFNAGSYGGIEAYIINIAKQMGIVTSEMQHGVINSNHIAYNYNKDILKEYKNYLPDYFLVWGKAWADSIRTSSKKILIGNPQLVEKMKFYRGNEKHHLNESSKKKILIVSQGTITNLFVRLTKELSKMVDKKRYEIIYRLHPGEVAFENRYKELKFLNNVSINKKGDIYELIESSDYIVGFNSTTIFEATVFQKPIFVYKHILSDLYIPQAIGKRFSSAEELYHSILNNENIEANYDFSYYWEMNWRENYKNFIESVI